jgi:hypothetical protein
MLFGSIFTAALVLGVAAPAFAHDCVNLSKNLSSVSVVVGPDCNGPGQDQITILSNGLAQRVNNFGFTFTYTGPVGIDVNCDGTADFASYSPGQGTDGVVPGAEHGQGENRAICKGVTDVEDAFADGCLVIS